MTPGAVEITPAVQQTVHSNKKTCARAVLFAVNMGGTISYIPT